MLRLDIFHFYKTYFLPDINKTCFHFFWFIVIFSLVWCFKSRASGIKEYYCAKYKNYQNDNLLFHFLRLLLALQVPAVERQVRNEQMVRNVLVLRHHHLKILYFKLFFVFVSKIVIQKGTKKK